MLIIKEIVDVCGLIPEGFIKANPKGNEYVFISDPNFQPINLINFLGNVVTVNSYQECYYYVDLGFGVNTFTIYNLLSIMISVILLIFFIYLFKKNFFKIKFYVSRLNNQKFLNIFINIIFLTFLIFEIFIVFKYVLNKSISLNPFIDEYVSITSNYNFLTKLDFNSGGFLGGSHSKYLTSGPISALGSAIGWLISKDIYISRIFNYFWIVILNLFLLTFVAKKRSISFRYTLLFSLTMFLLIPWWQGALYSLGEIASMIVFVNAIFLYSNFRKLSLGLFGISIFLGKLLTALPFVGFYIIVLIKESSIKKVLNDITYFLLPLLPWFLLINLNYESGNFGNYLIDTLNFILKDNSASGLNTSFSLSFDNIKNSILSSEYQYWNIYEKGRLVLTPIFCILLLNKNKSTIDQKFGYITIPLISAIVIHYLWFWIISPLKWMRYSQHFMVVVVVTLFYLLLFDVLSKKFDYFFCCMIIGSLMDNNEKNFFILIFILIIAIYTRNKNVWINTLKISLACVIVFDLTHSVLRQNDVENKSFKLDSCTELIMSDVCRYDYLEYENNG